MLRHRQGQNASRGGFGDQGQRGKTPDGSPLVNAGGRTSSPAQGSFGRPQLGTDRNNDQFVRAGPTERTMELSPFAYDFATKLYDHLRKDNIRPPKWPSAAADPSKKAAAEEFKLAYRKYRGQVYSSLRKADLIDDPEKRRRLADALPFKGICEDMCPEFEQISRIAENDVYKEEKETQPDGLTQWPNQLKMVKKFARSAAGQDAPLPMDVRSVDALQRTLDYLFNDLLQSEDNLPSMHSFLWDRTRAVRKDFTFHSQKSPKEMKVLVFCFETITRFHAVALHLLSRKGHAQDDFDESQEIEQLGRTILSLIEAYDACRERNIQCENEAEFRAYYLLLNVNDPSIVKRIPTWGKETWFESEEIQTALSLVQTMEDSRRPRGPMKPRRPITLSDTAFTNYFDIVEDPKVSYTMACIAEIHFTAVRQNILRNLVKGYSRPRDPPRNITAVDLNRMLRFDTAEEAQAFAETHDFTFSTNYPAGKAPPPAPYLVLDDRRKIVPSPRVKQSFSGQLVERKRGNQSLPYVIYNTIYEATDAKPMEMEDSPDSLFVSQINPASAVPATSLSAQPIPPFPSPAAQTAQISGVSSPFGAPAQQTALPSSGLLNPFGAPAPGPLNPFGVPAGQPETSGNPSIFSLPAAPNAEPLAVKLQSQPVQPTPSTPSNTSIFTPKTAEPAPASIQHPLPLPNTVTASPLPAQTSAPPKSVSFGSTSVLGSNALPPVSPATSSGPPTKPVQPPATSVFAPTSNVVPSVPSVLGKEPPPQEPSATMPAGSIKPIPSQPAIASKTPTLSPTSPTGAKQDERLSSANAMPLEVSNKQKQVFSQPNPQAPPDATKPRASQAPTTIKPTPVVPPPPPSPKQDLLDSFTRWFVLGDDGLMDHFAEFTVQDIVAQAFEQWAEEEFEKRRKEEDELSWQEARKFRAYSLGVRYFYRWQANARARARQRILEQGKRKMQIYRERERIAQKNAREEAERAERQRRKDTLERIEADGQRLSTLASRGKRRRSGNPEEQLLASGIFSGLPDERVTARRVVREAENHERWSGSFQSHPYAGSDLDIPPRRLSISTREQARTPDSTESKTEGWKTRSLREKFGLEHRRSVSASGSVYSTSRLRQSLQATKTTNFSRNPSADLSDDDGGPKRKLAMTNGFKTKHWNLRARGFVPMPDGKWLPESMANSGQAGKTLDGHDFVGAPPSDYDLDSVVDGDIADNSSAGLHQRLARLRGSSVHNSGDYRQWSRNGSDGFLSPPTLPPGRLEAPPGKRKRDSADVEDDTRSSSPSVAKRPFIGKDESNAMLEDVQSMVRELKEAMDKLDEDRAFFREQSGVLGDGS